MVELYCFKIDQMDYILNRYERKNAQNYKRKDMELDLRK